MTSAFGWLSRLCVLAVLLVPATAPQPAAAPSGETPVAGAEVRLRKLHLVRPDLIPYPIAYEVCC
jgi:hypothetical protein